MLNDRLYRPAPGPHVVVVGNHKGGCGKSTVAIHIIVALLTEGRRVATFDADIEQQTLTRYLENRQTWGRAHNVQLELPDHYPITEVAGPNLGRNEVADAKRFALAISMLEERYDFIVIDTPSGGYYLSLLAHAMADTLVTPINDSFVDLDLIGTIGPSTQFGPRRSRYIETVEKAAPLRRTIRETPTDWIVIRNRLSTLYSRNERQISEILEAMAPEIGFRTARGLTERIIYREFFPVGLTAFDPLDETLLGLKPSMSHLMARVEVRDLVTTIGLLPPKQAEDADNITRLAEELRLPNAPQLSPTDARPSERPRAAVGGNRAEP
jgi:chromosome partitioning protein